MITKKTLEDNGLTPALIRKIFTAGATDIKASEDEKEKVCDYRKIRDRIEKRIQGRLQAGILFSVKHSRLFQSVDLALDTDLITQEVIPLAMYAKGMLTLDNCAKQLDELGCAKEFVRYEGEDAPAGEQKPSTMDRKTRKLKDIDVPKFFEVAINLIRSYNTRREAAQNARYSNSQPFYKFDPRGSLLEDKLRAEIVNEIVDRQSDDFGYRHEQEQTVKRIFKYGRTVSFITKGWTQDCTWVPKEESTNEAFRKDEADKDAEKVWEKDIQRQGVDFIEPHPTRIFYDIKSPLAKINTGHGIDYLGYWDIRRYGDLKNQSSYFNLDSLNCAGALLELAGKYPSFFQYYYDKAVIDFPTARADVAAKNDRAANVGIYQETEKDKGVFVTEYFEKIIPKDEGISEYPYPLWWRLIIGGDSTIIGGEFLTVSTPAAYCGLNQDDDRLVSPSPSHEIMPFQDQVTNLLTEALIKMKQSLAMMVLIDKDMLTSEDLKKFEQQLGAKDWYSKLMQIPFSGSKAKKLGLTGENIRKDIITIVRTEVSQSVNQCFTAVLSMMSIIERLLILSPQELGQPAPREISAREVQEISASTSAMFDMISSSIDRFRDAKKKIIFESIVTQMEGEFEASVKDSFSQDVMDRVGLRKSEDGTDDPRSSKTTVIGSPEKLKYTLLFNSRDGSTRASNAQGATALAQALQVPGMIERLNSKQLEAILGEVMRLATGHNILYELADEGDQPAGTEQRIAQLEMQIQQLVQAAGGGQPQPPQPGQAQAALPPPPPAAL